MFALIMGANRSSQEYLDSVVRAISRSNDFSARVAEKISRYNTCLEVVEKIIFKDNYIPSKIQSRIDYEVLNNPQTLYFSNRK